MPRVLVATPESVGRRLSGPALRAANIARILSTEHDVVLASCAGESVSPIDGRAVAGPDQIHAEYDAAVIQDGVLRDHQELRDSSIPIAMDWFDPQLARALHQPGAASRRDPSVAVTSHIAAQAARGDLFLCGTESQRSHWLGVLRAHGRINQATHNQDPTFRSLITTAPFGVTPVGSNRRTPLRSTFSSIGDHDPILVWVGALDDWLDPLLVIDALPIVLEENPDTRLIFLAGPHPNTGIDKMGIRGRAIERARNLRLFGRHVFFVNQWIDYDERLRWIADATIGVTADRADLIGELSTHPQVLDHLSVGLPSVGTIDGTFGTELVSSGAAVATERNHLEFGTAIASLINDDLRLGEMSRAARTMAAARSWEDMLHSLTDWMRDPQPAADRRNSARFDPGRQMVDGLRRIEDGPGRRLRRGLSAARRRPDK